MKRSFSALLVAGALAGCQAVPTATSTTTSSANTSTTPAQMPTTPAAPAAAGAPTAAGARAAIGRYLQSQPNAGLYVVDSARATDLGAYWQVLVPRTDWAKRMPNRAAFEVDKQTGAVKNLMVK